MCSESQKCWPHRLECLLTIVVSDHVCHIDTDMMRPHFAGSLAVSLGALTLFACGGEDLVLPTDGLPANDGPAFLMMAGGDDQTGAPGALLSQPIQVQLVDESGNGIPDRQVMWVVSTGGGSASPESDVTDDEGYASTTWTLGAAGPNSLTAVVPGVPSLTFTATADDGEDGGGGGGGSGVPSTSASTLSADPTSIEVVNGRSTIRVTVRDEEGVPVPNAVVTLSATGSGNTLTQPSAPTGADGVAVGTLSSTVAGTKDVIAVVNGTLQLDQTAQIFVAISPATRIEAVEGNNQRAEAGSPVPLAPSVRVTNAAGQPVAGYAVNFVVTRGGGTVTGSSQVTNADGIARVGSWTLGSPGQNELEARAGTLNGSPVRFQATAPPAAEPHHFIFLVPPHDVKEDEEFTVKVAIVDAEGTIVPLSGIEIYVGLHLEDREVPTNTRLLGDRFRDTENGVAEFQLRITNGRHGTIAGGTKRYRLRALSDELPELGPYGPEPWLYSDLFEVRGD